MQNEFWLRVFGQIESFVLRNLAAFFIVFSDITADNKQDDGYTGEVGAENNEGIK